MDLSEYSQYNNGSERHLVKYSRVFIPIVYPPLLIPLWAHKLAMCLMSLPYGYLLMLKCHIEMMVFFVQFSSPNHGPLFVILIITDIFSFSLHKLKPAMLTDALLDSEIIVY